MTTLTAGEIHLNSVSYPLAHDSQLPRGRRAIVRGTRPSQNADPSVIREVSWRLSGPVGQSREREDGALLTDYAENLETYYDRLLTSGPKRNTLTINSKDDGGTGDSHLGVTATLGGFHLGSGTSTLGAANASHIQEDRGQVFVDGGQFVRQINPADMSLVESKALNQRVEGMAFWQGQGYVGIGPDETMQRRTTVSSSGSAYVDVGSIEAGAMVTTLKHLFFVDRRSANQNKIRFTLDNFATESNPFSVHDTGQAPNGMGSYAGTALLGFQRGIHGFSALGDPVEVHTDVKEFPDDLNGKQQRSAWGWHYSITALGLLAAIPGEIGDNRVGPGALSGFEGPTGQPRSIGKLLGSLIYSELVGSDSYVYRGRFNPAITPGTGRPDWYPLFKVTSGTVSVFGATTGRTLPTLLDGEDDDTLGWTELSFKDREIADSAYVFSTTGGTWFGSTLMRTQALHCNLRWASFISENCDSSNSWTLAVSVDESAYVNVGSAVQTNGHQVIRPVSGGVPLTTVDFHTLKPRLTQIAASTTAPPQIRGDLTLTYDERPDMVEEVICTIVLGQEGRDAETEWDELRALMDPEGNGQSPKPVLMPFDTATTYGFVTGVGQMRDLEVNGVLGVDVTVVRWDTA